VTHSSYTTLYLEMAAPPSPSAVLRDEIQTAESPDQPPHNLPHLVSVEVIEQLSECQLISYLTGYGTNPIPTGPNPGDTDYLRRDHLMALVGVQG
jgi:hypothetical protein